MTQDTTYYLYDMLESAWGVIANAGGGNWNLESEDWQTAAKRWRDKYHEVLGEICADKDA